MERVQRLYDCITEVSDQYIQEAETFEKRQGKTLDINWKQWGSLVAALVVVAGVGLAMTQLGGGGSSDASAPAMSAPACSAPAAGEPSVEEPAAETIPEQEDGRGDMESTVQGNEWMAADWQIYASLEELVLASDVIVEGRVVDVHEDVALDIGMEPVVSKTHLYTVADVEVTSVMKGDAEVGEVISIKLGQGAVVNIGAEWLCFLEDYRGQKPDMPLSPMNPKQGIIPISGDTVRVSKSFPPEFHGDEECVDRIEVLKRIQAYVDK